MNRCLTLLLSVSTVAFLATPVRAADDVVQVYIGTYSSGGSRGIYVAELDLATGKLGETRLAAESENPSFLELHPSGKFLYAVNEVSSFQGQRGQGSISAFTRDAASGELKPLNQQSSQGAGPCHLVVAPNGDFVLAANYGGGSVVSLPINDDGSLAPACSFIQHKGSSVNAQRQKEPHAHSINLDPSGKFAVAADLGTDQVLIYAFDGTSGRLSPNEPAFATVAPGSGPRHFAFHPILKYGYVINELKSTVTAFAHDEQQGRLTERQTISTLPDGFDGSNYTAEIRVHPNGKFVYGSNRGHNSLAIFAIDLDTGKLTAIGHQATRGKTPRNFNIDPSGRYLLAANQDSGNIVAFAIDDARGTLTETCRIEVAKPVCLRFAK